MNKEKFILKAALSDDVERGVQVIHYWLYQNMKGIPLCGYYTIVGGPNGYSRKDLADQFRRFADFLERG